ncbi:serine protease, partial [Dehalococcoidia bacterium]|nr:serine protease [Dehalococcoidia bacterium]
LAVTMLSLIFRRGIPAVEEYFPKAMADLPPEAQFLVTAGLIVFVACVVGSTVFRLIRNAAERRRVDVFLQQAQSDRKMMVYVYGSGAKGFCNAMDRLGRGVMFRNLMIFAQPPLDTVKKGYLKIRGCITACMPVQSAKGTFMAANAARAAEARICDEGHAVFLEAIGAEDTTVEWSLVHIGPGHTSVSCHTAWEEKRTSMNHGALPGRFVIVVRDKVEGVASDEPDDDESSDTPNPTQDHSKHISTSDVSRMSLARVSSGGKVGSGVVLDREGLILTAAHVLGDPKSAHVQVGDHSEMLAAVLYMDTTADVAFLQVTPSESLIPMVIGRSDNLEIGDRLVAYGYPADSEYEGMPVAALGSVVNVVPDRSNTVIQSDAMVTSGCSGGPIATLDGRLVGMINATTPDEDRSKLLTCAISVEDILDVQSSWRPSEAASQARNADLDNKPIHESKNIKGGSTNNE